MEFTFADLSRVQRITATTANNFTLEQDTPSGTFAQYQGLINNQNTSGEVCASLLIKYRKVAGLFNFNGNCFSN